MKKVQSGSCEKCGKTSKQYHKIYGKKLCLKCTFDFYKDASKIMEKDIRVKKAFKSWFFEMEMEE